MRLTAPNVLKGKVIEVVPGVTTARIKIATASGAVITSSITMEAALADRTPAARMAEGSACHAAESRQFLV